MTDLKIDEEFLKGLADSARGFINAVEGQINIMTDKKDDVFKRFMAFNKIKDLLETLAFISKLQKENLAAGLYAGHEFFQTEVAKENGWDRNNIEKNDFFIQPKKEQNTMSGIVDVSELLRRLAGQVEKDIETKENVTTH